MRSVAARFGYPWPDVGIYIQPQHQGVAHHVEFNFPYDPNDASEVAKARDIYLEASAALARPGRLFLSAIRLLVGTDLPARRQLDRASADGQADRRSRQHHEPWKALLLGVRAEWGERT